MTELLQNLITTMLVTFFATGNTAGLLLISYLRLRYGGPDAWQMVGVMWMWNGVVIVASVLCWLMASYVPPEAFVAVGRFLMQL